MLVVRHFEALPFRPLVCRRIENSVGRLVSAGHVGELFAVGAVSNLRADCDDFSGRLMPARRDICDRDINSLFSVSKYGRLADSRVDLREFDGKPLVFIDKGELDVAQFSPFFESLDLKELDIGGAKLSVLMGEGFNYMAYRNDYLREIEQRYYQRPDWLPPAACPFTERYFPPEA